ncbi:diguanylate cyclase domain-containing protein [Treponema phagedenis]|uniref:diguanylate cyclase domain-containing protein n=1 Tax=Treponema phagedenis TaxID=162 RepID=UPI0011E6F7ED|nr:diguanylate cyclase [Treponema phagedenis]QEK03862.1 diguanylate cyclase [Treponema phagedenis]QKS92207.1 diguanylate cyclase [Treponema phagedenis]
MRKTKSIHADKKIPIRINHDITQQLHLVFQTLKDSDKVVYFLYIDIDSFKTINEVWGHFAGDHLIEDVADIISSCLNYEDSAFHIGGDEFSVFHGGSKESALALADTILEKVSNTNFIWNENTFNICVSIGIVPITCSTAREQDVINAAQQATLEAYQTGGNAFKLFSPLEMKTYSTKNVGLWLQKIQNAVDNDGFVLYKQEIAPLNKELPNKKYEILLRMKDTDGSIIPPDSFIPAAEKYNMIYLIARWVIKHVFASVAKMKEIDHPDKNSVFQY